MLGLGLKILIPLIIDVFTNNLFHFLEILSFIIYRGIYFRTYAEGERNKEKRKKGKRKKGKRKRRRLP